MKAYWFSDNGKAVFGNRVPFEVREEPYKVDGKIRACHNGLHASVHPLDALQYAYGSTLDLVELSGTVVSGVDKHAASHRKHVKRINAEKILWEFARWCALSVANTWDTPDIVRRFLETGDESIRKEAYRAASATMHESWAARSAKFSAQPPFYKSSTVACVVARDSYVSAYRAVNTTTYVSVAAGVDTHKAETAASEAEAAARESLRNKFQELVDKAFAEDKA